MSESPFIRIEFMLQEDTGELISDFEHLCMFEKMMITSVDPDDLLFPVHCK